LCIGCVWSLDEMAEWSRVTPERRAEIMAELPARKPQIGQRRGGRGARMRDRAR